jgi:hypothetical protein
MSNVLFPTLPGLTWDVKRKPCFHTLVQTVATGYSVRLPLLADPLWEFTCSFEFLRDDVPHDEFNLLEGFFLSRKGQFDSFLLDLGSLTKNSDDSALEDQLLPIDANGNAPLVRLRGASQYAESVYEINGVPAIKKNGGLLVAGTDYNLVAPGEVANLNANGISYGGYVVQLLTHAGVGPSDVITADFGFLYRVRFQQDEQEFGLFAQLLYEAQEVKLVSARE